MISANLLIARFDITFNHETFYQFMKFRIDHTTVKNFFGDTNLLFILFVGVGVVGVYDNCRVLEILFLIFFPQKTKIFVMVVRDSLSMFIYSTAKDGMCKWITSCFNFPASVNKTMRTLCSNNRVQHNADNHRWSDFSCRQAHPYH